MRRIAIQLFDELGREPTDEELAKECGVSAAKISQLRRVSMRPTSLNAFVGDEADAELGDLIADETAVMPGAGFGKPQSHQTTSQRPPRSRRAGTGYSFPPLPLN